MPPKGKSAERLKQEAEAQRARAAALQYLTKTGSGPSVKEIAQQQNDREKWTNPTTQAVQQRLAHLLPARASGVGNAPTGDNTLAVMAAHRARRMLQEGDSTADNGGGYGGGYGADQRASSGGGTWGNGMGSGDSNDDLPDGWKPAVDPTSGETYYWNEKTKKTSWDRPRGQKEHAADKAPAKDDEKEILEDGWEEVEDPQSGQTYYWHRESNETSWTKPVKKIVSLQQAREAKSKLDAILKLCGPSKKSSTQPKRVDPGASKTSLQPNQSEETNSRKRDIGDADAESTKKARLNR